MWYIGDIPIIDRNHPAVVTGFVFTILSVIVVTLRLITRVKLVHVEGIDDLLIAISTVGSVAFFIVGTLQMKVGLGEHTQDPENVPKFLKLLLATIALYHLVNQTCKLSILFQYKRVFHTPAMQRSVLVFLIWMSLYSLACLFTTVFTCVPLAKYWDDSAPGGCLNRTALQYCFAGLNIIHDFILLIMPLPFLKSLKIDRRSKIVLIGVFACGGFATIVSIVRLHALYENNSVPVQDQPVVGVDILLWSVLELNVAIICASVPALKQLFTKFLPGFFSALATSTKPRSGCARSAAKSERESHAADQQHQSFEQKGSDKVTHREDVQSDSSDRIKMRDYDSTSEEPTSPRRLEAGTPKEGSD